MTRSRAIPDDAPHLPVDARRLTPEQLKAIAHPLRFRMLEMLQTEGPSTASALGRAVGESSGTTSYHLRQLGNAGLIVEDAEAGTGRDRWWRSAGGWTLDTDLTDDPATRDDAALVLDEAMAARVARLRRWQHDRDRWDRSWREATMMANTQLALTPAEMRELGRELRDVVSRYRNRHDRDDPPPGTARIVVQTDVFPIGDPPSIEPPEHGQDGPAPHVL